MMPFPPAYWKDKMNQSMNDIMLECFSPSFPKFVNRKGMKKPSPKIWEVNKKTIPNFGNGKEMIKAHFQNSGPGYIRDGVNGKKTFSFGHCPNDGGVYPCPKFWPSF